MGKKGEDGVGNTSCHVQLLGVGTDTGCTVPSVLLFFDRKRYLFNVGEGFQRYCVEHKVKLTKVTSVLSTRVTTHGLGGLPGMLLTLRDATAGGLLSGQLGMSVYGPVGLYSAVNAFRCFVNLKEMGLQAKQFGSKEENSEMLSEICDPIISDDTIKIIPVVIRPSVVSGEGEEEPEAKKPRIERMGGMLVEKAVSCYVCQLPDIRGKFLPQQAASLGVPRGPMYGQLQKGQSVTSSNGRVVTPEEVMEPSTPGPTVIIVDCPSVEFIRGLGDQNSGIGVWASQDDDKDKIVIHLCPRDVLRCTEYQNFIRSFPMSTNHILMAESRSDKVPIMAKSTVLHSKLNALDENIFSPLHHYMEEFQGSHYPDNCRPGTNMLKYCLRPVSKKGFDESECGQEISTEATKKQLANERPEALEFAKKAKDFVIPTDGPHVPPGVITSSIAADIRVTFLGTGAAIPSKYRNVTGILLQASHLNASILMDCGESSLGQIYKKLGREGTEEVLRSLKFIWISHIHADHHIGLPAILGARTRLLGSDCDPLLVIGPKPLRKALGYYSSVEPMNFAYVEASATEEGNEEVTAAVPDDVRDLLENAKNALNLRRLESVRVIHCAHSFALVLESKDFDEGDKSSTGWKIVFSGDTRPSSELAKAASGATLLIHEATFDDSMMEEAKEKRHCTTLEAINIGKEAKAYSTILTHFSQRYPKIPVIDDSFSGHVGVAFDLMTVSLADLPRLPVLVPAFKMLFEEDLDGDQETAAAAIDTRPE